MDTSVLNAFKTAIINRITGAVNTHNSDTSSHSNKQDKSNLTTSWGSILSDTMYPSEKLVKESIDSAKTKINVIDDLTDIDEDGIYLYHEKEYLSITVDKTEIILGYDTFQWFPSQGDVVVDWGDGSTTTINNPTMRISHTYEDNITEHTIIFKGDYTKIGKYTFMDKITSINIPNYITEVGEGALQGFDGSIEFPESVITIGPYLFGGQLYADLNYVKIPSTVQTLGRSVCGRDNETIIYDLYWETPILQYTYRGQNNFKGSNSTITFIIPYGSTDNYVNAGYPLNELQERSA